MNKAYTWKNIKEKKKIVKPNAESPYVVVKLKDDELLEEYNIRKDLYKRIEYIITNKKDT